MNIKKADRFEPRLDFLNNQIGNLTTELKKDASLDMQVNDDIIFSKKFAEFSRLSNLISTKLTRASEREFRTVAESIRKEIIKVFTTFSQEDIVIFHRQKLYYLEKIRKTTFLLLELSTAPSEFIASPSKSPTKITRISLQKSQKSVLKTTKEIEPPRPPAELLMLRSSEGVQLSAKAQANLTNTVRQFVSENLFRFRPKQKEELQKLLAELEFDSQKYTEAILKELQIANIDRQIKASTTFQEALETFKEHLSSFLKANSKNVPSKETKRKSENRSSTPILSTGLKNRKTVRFI